MTPTTKMVEYLFTPDHLIQFFMISLTKSFLQNCLIVLTKLRLANLQVIKDSDYFDGTHLALLFETFHQV